MLTFTSAVNWQTKCSGVMASNTCCCKSYHKATVKFSSNPTISFSRKSTRKDPPVKSDQNKAISVHVLWVSFHHRSTPVLSSSHQKINFLHYIRRSVLLLLKNLNVPLSLSRGTVFRRQKNPRRGYRPKIAGILFVCNEPEDKYYTVPSLCYKYNNKFCKLKLGDNRNTFDKEVGISATKSQVSISQSPSLHIIVNKIIIT